MRTFNSYSRLMQIYKIKITIKIIILKNGKNLIIININLIIIDRQKVNYKIIF